MTSKKHHRFSLLHLAIVDTQEGDRTVRVATGTMMMIATLEGTHIHSDEMMMIDVGLEAPAPEDLAEAAAEAAPAAMEAVILAGLEAADQADLVEAEAAEEVAAVTLIRRTALKVDALMGAAGIVCVAPTSPTTVCGPTLKEGEKKEIGGQMS